MRVKSLENAFGGLKAIHGNTALSPLEKEKDKEPIMCCRVVRDLEPNEGLNKAGSNNSTSFLLSRVCWDLC
jgi:hypothetical protein